MYLLKIPFRMLIDPYDAGHLGIRGEGLPLVNLGRYSDMVPPAGHAQVRAVKNKAQEEHAFRLGPLMMMFSPELENNWEIEAAKEANQSFTRGHNVAESMYQWGKNQLYTQGTPEIKGPLAEITPMLMDGDFANIEGRRFRANYNTQRAKVVQQALATEHPETPPPEPEAPPAALADMEEVQRQFEEQPAVHEHIEKCKRMHLPAVYVNGASGPYSAQGALLITGRDECGRAAPLTHDLTMRAEDLHSLREEGQPVGAGTINVSGGSDSPGYSRDGDTNMGVPPALRSGAVERYF